MNWQVIEDLFEQALHEGPADREQFVRSTAPSTEIAEHVLRMVRADELATGFLTSSPRTRHAGASLAVDTYVGEWRVIESIGVGGMGDVYKVIRDTDDFQQYGALKLLHDRDERVEARFDAERRLAATLSHPSIARLLDGGRLADGRLYMVMDLVAGEQIIDAANRRDLDSNQRLDLFLELCDAVQYAHRMGILHRDIKPGNVLVSTDAVLKLVDFGVASFLTDSENGTSAPLTVAYAAPEQLAGDAVSPATDIYALGVVACELLTGNRSLDATSTINDELRNIIIRCTETDPTARYASVADLQDDVRRYFRREPLVATAGGPLYRIGKFVQRYRAASLTAGLSLVGLSIALLVTLSAWEQSRDALQQAKEAGDRWEFEARTTSGLRRVLLQLYGVESEAGSPIKSAEIDARLLALSKEAETAARLGAVQQAHDMYAIGGHFMRRFDHDNAIDIYERLLATNVSDPLLEMGTRTALAWSLDGAGRKEEAVAMALDLMAVPTLRQDPLHPLRIQADRLITDASGDPDDIARMIEQLEAAISDELNVPIEDRFDMHWNLNQLGVLNMRIGNYAEAARAFVRAFYHSRELGVRSLTVVASASNAAQGQIYVLREGRPPLDYLPDYLPYVNGEYGDDTFRHGFMQSLMADAALLEGDPVRALEHANVALSILQEDVTYRGGWHALVQLTRMRSLLASNDASGARLVHDTLANHVQAAPEAARHTTACSAALATALLAASSKADESAKTTYDSAVATCRGGQDRPLRAPFQFHADAIAALL